MAAYLFSLHGSCHVSSHGITHGNSHGSIPLQLAWQQSWQHRWLTEHHAGPLAVQPFLREADLPTQDPADEWLSGECCCCTTSERTAGRPSAAPRCPALTALSAGFHDFALTALSTDLQCPAVSAGLHWVVLAGLSADRHCSALAAPSEYCYSLGHCLHSARYILGCGANWELSNHLAPVHRQM